MKREPSPETTYRRAKAKRDRKDAAIVEQVRRQLAAEWEAAKPRRGRPKKVAANG